MRDPFWIWLGAILLMVAGAGAVLFIAELRHARRWAEEDRRARMRLQGETVVAFTGSKRRGRT